MRNVTSTIIYDLNPKAEITTKSMDWHDPMPRNTFSDSINIEYHDDEDDEAISMIADFRPRWEIAAAWFMRSSVHWLSLSVLIVIVWIGKWPFLDEPPCVMVLGCSFVLSSVGGFMAARPICSGRGTNQECIFWVSNIVFDILLIITALRFSSSRLVALMGCTGICSIVLLGDSRACIVTFLEKEILSLTLAAAVFIPREYEKLATTSAALVLFQRCRELWLRTLSAPQAAGHLDALRSLSAAAGTGGGEAPPDAATTGRREDPRPSGAARPLRQLRRGSVGDDARPRRPGFELPPEHLFSLRRRSTRQFEVIRVKSRISFQVPRDAVSVVDDLDQLFAQAAGVDGLLRSKVQQWALASRGHFRLSAPAADGSRYVLWEAAALSPELRGRVEWGGLKSIGRSIEKLVRSYRYDVSRLVDVCRKSIVFETVEDLRTCLAAMWGDTEVVVERVKNRLDPGYDARATAGYRDVAVNLRVVGLGAAELGLDTHVCEVQLVLRGFADLKVSRDPT